MPLMISTSPNGSSRKPHTNQIRCAGCSDWVPTLVTGRCPKCVIQANNAAELRRGVYVRTVRETRTRSQTKIEKDKFLTAVEDVIGNWLPVICRGRVELVPVADVERVVTKKPAPKAPKALKALKALKAPKKKTKSKKATTKPSKRASRRS